VVEECCTVAVGTGRNTSAFVGYKMLVVAVGSIAVDQWAVGHMVAAAGTIGGVVLVDCS